jgi:hypothetical protein
MKTITLITAAAIAAPVAVVLPSPSANAALTASFCQPLSASNLEECCAADNWRELIPPTERRYCPPINSFDRGSGRLGNDLPNGNGGGGGGGGGGNGVAGNPGNDKAVGKSGEKIEKGMAENLDHGNKGKSN